MQAEVNEQYVKGQQFAEGKTKRLFEVVGHPELAIAKNKRDITAFNDPRFTKQFAGKAEYCTTQTCRVFEMLQRHGIAVAYRQQLSDTEFLVDKCRPIPLEVITRRYIIPASSYLKRHPNFMETRSLPHHFEFLPVEFYLKTTNGELRDEDGNLIVGGLKPGEEDDPLILDPSKPIWQLYHSHRPVSDPSSLLCEVERDRVLCDCHPTLINTLRWTTTRSFGHIEQGFNLGRKHLIDIKLEFGRTRDGRILVMDVLDNDCWRLMDEGFEIDFSKQSHRNGEELEVVKANYRLVAAWTEEYMPKC